MWISDGQQHDFKLQMRIITFFSVLIKFLFSFFTCLFSKTHFSSFLIHHYFKYILVFFIFWVQCTKKAEYVFKQWQQRTIAPEKTNSRDVKMTLFYLETAASHNFCLWNWDGGLLPWCGSMCLCCKISSYSLGAGQSEQVLHVLSEFFPLTPFHFLLS